MTFHEAIVQVLWACRVTAGLETDAALAETAGIPYGSLVRKLTDSKQMTTEDVDRLATAVGVEAFDLMAWAAQWRRRMVSSEAAR